MSKTVLFILAIFSSFLACSSYYVGSEVGKAPGETKLLPKAKGESKPDQATTLAEAAYLPYVYGVGNNVVTFLRSVIPALQPKVDFFAEQIQDTIDIANTKLMQKLENGNNGIIAVENFFTGLMKAVVFGKGPDDEERRRRAAIAFIKSGMLTTSTTTKRPTIATTTITSSTGQPIKRSTTTEESISISTMADIIDTTTTLPDELTTDNPPKVEKIRDNNFSKMKVVEIVKSLA